MKNAKHLKGQKSTNTKQENYRERRRAKGEKDILLWVPELWVDQFRALAEFCCENPDYYPMMCRSIKSGKFAKGADY